MQSLVWDLIFYILYHLMVTDDLKDEMWPGIHGIFVILIVVNIGCLIFIFNELVFNAVDNNDNIIASFWILFKLNMSQLFDWIKHKGNTPENQINMSKIIQNTKN